MKDAVAKYWLNNPGTMTIVRMISYSHGANRLSYILDLVQMNKTGSRPKEAAENPYRPPE